MSVTSVMLMVGIAAIFLSLLIGLSAIGVFTQEVRGVAKSLAAVQAFSAAPQSMQDELEPSFNERVIAPALGRLVGFGKRITPSDYAERIRRKLDVAGNPNGISVDRILALKVVGLAVGFIMALGVVLLFGVSLAPAFVVCFAGTALGYYAPNIFLYQKGADRNAQVQKDLPDAIDLLTISVEAGLGFDSALSQVARNTSGPLAQEFARVLQEMQIGLGRSNALRALGERTALPDLRSFASAMVQADAFGIPIGQVLRVQANEIRVKRRQRAEEKAQKVPVKILMPLILCILPCLFIVVMGPGVIAIMDAFSRV